MRVLIIADSVVAAEAIRRGLRHAPSCHVLGFSNGAHSCGRSLAESRPDVVLIDEMTHPTAALARIREARALVPDAKLVLLSRDMDPARLAEASAAGIDAAIAKSAHLASVGMLVREIAAGNVYHAFAAAEPKAQESTVTDILTARELETLRLVADGLSNGSIASQLWVTEQTVKFHLSNVYRKLGVANRTQASHFAYRHGLLNPGLGDAIPMRPAPIPAAA
jgi:DNA-binding NarL/FixJ family response regulator